MTKYTKFKVYRFGKIEEQVSGDFETEYWQAKFCSDLEDKHKSSIVLKLLFDKALYPDVKDLPKMREFEWRRIQ